MGCSPVRTQDGTTTNATVLEQPMPLGHEVLENYHNYTFLLFFLLVSSLSAVYSL